MEMQTHEIVRMYKEAADKKKQIVILSQMNLCTRKRSGKNSSGAESTPALFRKKENSPARKKPKKQLRNPPRPPFSFLWQTHRLCAKLSCSMQAIFRANSQNAAKKSRHSNRRRGI